MQAAPAPRLTSDLGSALAQPPLPSMSCEGLPQTADLPGNLLRRESQGLEPEQGRPWTSGLECSVRQATDCLGEHSSAQGGRCQPLAFPRGC